jgi:hypothetical protein
MIHNQVLGTKSFVSIVAEKLGLSAKEGHGAILMRKAERAMTRDKQNRTMKAVEKFLK